MFLINIPNIQAPQRLVVPTGSDTGGGESSLGDPSGQGLSASASPTPASSRAAGAAPALGIRQLSGNAELWVGPAQWGKAVGSWRPALLQSHQHGNGGPGGWNSALGHGQGGACLELLTGGKRLEMALQNYIASQTPLRNNSQKLLSVPHTWLPRVCIA